MEFQVGDTGMVQRLGKATEVRGCKCCAVSFDFDICGPSRTSLTVNTMFDNS